MVMISKPAGPSPTLVATALVCLCVQNSALVLSMKYTRSVLQEQYFTSTAVVAMECVKFVLSWAMMMHSDGAAISDVLSQQREAPHFAAALFVVDGRSLPIEWLIDGGCSAMCVRVCVFMCRPAALTRSLPMCVPSLLYVMQNSLQFVAVNHLDASSFTILSQLKILTTAVCSVLMLGTSLSLRKWRALLLLVIGAVLVQFPRDSSAASSAATLPAARSSVTGLAAVLGMVCLSGIAGIWLEKFLKNKDTAPAIAGMPAPPAASLWERNLQLSLYGMLFGLSSVAINDYQAVREHGFFYSYSLWTLFVILTAAVGGLIVAVVVKYTSTIVKGFATSISIILTSVCSLALFPSDELSTLFWIGAACVLLSIFNYNEEDALIQPTYTRLAETNGGGVSKHKQLKKQLVLASVEDGDTLRDTSEEMSLIRK